MARSPQGAASPWLSVSSAPWRCLTCRSRSRSPAAFLARSSLRGQREAVGAVKPPRSRLRFVNSSTVLEDGAHFSDCRRRCLPKSGHASSNSPKVGRLRVRVGFGAPTQGHRSTSVEVARILAAKAQRCDKHEPRFGSETTRSGPIPADFRTRPNLARNRRRFQPCEGQVRPISTNTCPKQTNIGPEATNFAPRSTNSVLMSTKVGPPSANMDQACLARNRPNLARRRSVFSRSRANLDQLRPSVAFGTRSSLARLRRDWANLEGETMITLGRGRPRLEARQDHLAARPRGRGGPSVQTFLAGRP